MNLRVIKRIDEIGTVVGGATPSTKTEHYWGEAIPWLSPKDLTGYRKRYISRGNRSITGDGLNSCSAQLLPKGAVLFTSRAPIGYVAIANQPLCTNQGFKSVIPNSNVDSLFLYYLLRDKRDHIESLGAGTTFKEVSAATMRSVELEIPTSLEEQRKIAAVLDSLDSKIELNNQINDYLEELLVAIYKRVSIEGSCASRRADEVFSIHIGKTPPRKEPEWFASRRGDNVVWMSIKDMGSAGVYLLDSSEYLTPNAVDRFNIKHCTPGSVLLSFKLTVGRVGIAAKEMVTNEAIACFSSDDPRKLAYLYPQLKTYDFDSLGSTSSIATAVNSKTIKGVQISLPSNDVLDEFYNSAKPLYSLLLGNAEETAVLEELRDALLPKLMSGEIDVSQVDITQLNNHLDDLAGVIIANVIRGGWLGALGCAVMRVIPVL